MNDYDYFYIAGDDVYMAVENLRTYLVSREVKRLEDGFMDKIANYSEYGSEYRSKALQTAKLRPRPLLLATPMMWRRVPVIAGGAGYAINQAALRLWGEHGADHFETDRLDSKEDFLFGKFMADHGVFLSDTQEDETGGCRFCMGADFTSTFNGKRSPVRPKRLQRLFGYQIKAGIDHCSERQISFHLKDDTPHVRNNTIAELMLRYHAILYHWCDDHNNDKEHRYHQQTIAMV
jgi:hypothetical protein